MLTANQFAAVSASCATLAAALHLASALALVLGRADEAAALSRSASGLARAAEPDPVAQLRERLLGDVPAARRLGSGRQIITGQGAPNFPALGGY